MPRFLRVCVLVASVGGVCCSGAESGSTSVPSIAIYSGDRVTDTTLAFLSEPLVFEVTDAHHTPLHGVRVTFSTGPRVPYPWQMTTIRPRGGGNFDYTVTDETDYGGHVGVEIRLGSKAGSAFVKATVQGTGIIKPASFTIAPGAPVGFGVAPRDTSVLKNGSYTLRANLVDSYRNPRDDSVAYSVQRGQASVTPSGLITGLATSRASILVTARGFQDSAALSVVPLGRLAVYRPPNFVGDSGGLMIFRTDGALMHVVVRRSYPPPAEGPFAWAPSGAQVAYVAGNALMVMDTLGRVRQVVPGDNLPVSNEYPPEYSSDGQWVYFTRGGYGYQQTCWRVRLDGTGLAQVSEVVPSGVEAGPSPNPADDRFVYLTNRVANGAPGPGLRILHLDTQAVDSIDTRGGYPRWSPVGDRIAFRGNDALLRTVKPDGTGLQLVGAQTIVGVGLAWSPDGSWLAAVGTGGLELVNANSGEVLPLAYGADFILPPAWLH